MFVINSVPDQYKTQKMCDKAVDNNPDALTFVPDRYETQKMCDKVVDEKILMIILLH